MSDCLKTLSAKPVPAPTDARAARLAKFQREQVIVDYLSRGVSVAEIAARVGVGEKRMRAIMTEILARRMPHPPREFVAIQVSRLNDAMLVAYSAMSPSNLKAVDQVVKIVRELDRYGGAFAAEWARPAASRLEAPAEEDVAFAKAWPGSAELTGEGDDDRPKNPTQSPENIESAPESLLAPPKQGESRPADLIRGEGPGRLAADARPALHPSLLPAIPGSGPGREKGRSAGGARPENPVQGIENTQSAPEIGRPAEAAPAAGVSAFDTPMILTPTGWKPPTMRMLLNGVAA